VSVYDALFILLILGGQFWTTNLSKEGKQKAKKIVAEEIKNLISKFKEIEESEANDPS